MYPGSGDGILTAGTSICFREILHQPPGRRCVLRTWVAGDRTVTAELLYHRRPGGGENWASQERGETARRAIQGGILASCKALDMQCSVFWTFYLCNVRLPSPVRVCSTFWWLHTCFVGVQGTCERGPVLAQGLSALFRCMGYRISMLSLCPMAR